MKRLLIMPSASCSGHFKHMIANQFPVLNNGYHQDEDIEVDFFEGNLTTDPLIKMAASCDLFQKRHELRETHPQCFNSVKFLESDTMLVEHFNQLIELIRQSQEIDIWLDVHTTSKMHAVFFIQAIQEAGLTANRTVNVYQYPLPIGEQSLETWDRNRVRRIPFDETLLENVDAIWQALTSDTPELAFRALRKIDDPDSWLFTLLKRMLEQLPERKTHLNRLEREILSTLGVVGQLRFQKLCSLHYAYFDDDFVNWTHLPAFLDRLRDKGLVHYNLEKHASLKAFVEENFLRNYQAFDRVEVILTEKGRDVLAGKAKANTLFDEQIPFSAGPAIWLWDEDEMKIVRG